MSWYAVRQLITGTRACLIGGLVVSVSLSGWLMPLVDAAPGRDHIERTISLGSGVVLGSDGAPRWIAPAGRAGASGTSSNPPEAGPTDSVIGCAGSPADEVRLPAWSASFDNPAGHTNRGFDLTAGMVASPSGDRVFATGATWVNGGYDMVTLAFDSRTGDPLWQSLFAVEGADHRTEVPLAITVSPDGTRVFVAGYVRGKASAPELVQMQFARIATVAYDAQSGERLWDAVYQAPDAVWGWATGLEVAPDGRDVYVTGPTQRAGAGGVLHRPHRRSHEFGGGGYRFTTIAHDTRTGETRWVAHYEGPDEFKNVMVIPTGISVAPDGEALYVSGYASGDFSVRLVFVTLSLRAADGTTAWTWTRDRGHDRNFMDGRIIHPVRTTMPRDGARVYVTGASGTALETYALDPGSGSTVWTSSQEFFPLHGMQFGSALSPDGRHLYLSGAVLRPPESGEVEWQGANLTAAYETDDGRRAWSTENPFGSAGVGPDDIPVALAVSPNGRHIYSAGYVRNARPWAWTTDQFYTVSYAAEDGRREWVAPYSTAPGTCWDHDIARFIAMSPAGDRVFVAGDFGYATDVGHADMTKFEENWFDIGVVAYDTADGTPDPTPSATQSPGPSVSPTPSESVTPTPSPTSTTTPTPDPGDRGTYPNPPDDPFFGPGDDFGTAGLVRFGTQWGPQMIDAPQAWQENRATGHGIDVAVLDTGVDLGHEDLACAGKLRIVSGSDAVANDSDPDDQNGHGTHVAGIVGACTNNGIGIAGIAPDATIVPIRVLNASGSGTDAQIIAGIDRAIAAGAEVINMSLGKEVVISQVLEFPEFDAALERASAAGVVVIAAAGNRPFPICNYPALAEDVVCVGATDARDQRSWYSTFANKPSGPTVVAPGGTGTVFCDLDSEDILSLYAVDKDSDACDGRKGYANLSGTSMAAPHVAGVAALVYDRLGGKRSPENAQQVIDALTSTAVDLGPTGHDPAYGSGRVDALAAVCSVGPSCGVDPDPTPTPTPTETTTASPSPTESVSASPSPSQSPEPDIAEVSFTENTAESGQHSDETLFEARLRDSSGEPIEGRELSFELRGESTRSFSATTDDDGVAAVTPRLEEKPGPHWLTVRFPGDEEHAGDADTLSFVVDKEDSALDLSETKGKDKALVAHLYDGDTPAEGIAGRTIDFYAGQDLIGSATTGNDGVATFKPPEQKGKKPAYEARFEGDDYYVGASDVSGGKGGNGGGGGNGGRDASTSYGGKVLLM